MARKPAVELAKEWLNHAEEGDSEAMAEMLSQDAVFYASQLRGRRFHGRDEIEDYLADTGFEASGYTYTPVDDEYAVVTLSLRRHLDGGGFADSTLAMVFKADGDEIVCLDVFASEHEALRSLTRKV
jgi:ketosteroid isomerase-like protein